MVYLKVLFIIMQNICETDGHERNIVAISDPEHCLVWDYNDRITEKHREKRKEKKKKEREGKKRRAWLNSVV